MNIARLIIGSFHLQWACYPNRIGNIHQASITPFRVAAPPDAVHPAVLVIPGGGYSILAIDKRTGISCWNTALSLKGRPVRSASSRRDRGVRVLD